MFALDGLGEDFFIAIGAFLRGRNARRCLGVLGGSSFGGNCLRHCKRLAALWTVQHLSRTGFVNYNMLAALVTVEFNVHDVRI